MTDSQKSTPAKKQKLDFSALYGEKGGIVCTHGDKASEVSTQRVNITDVLAKVLGGKTQKPNQN